MKRPSEDTSELDSSTNLAVRNRLRPIMQRIVDACHSQLYFNDRGKPFTVDTDPEIQDAMKNKNVKFLVQRFYQILKECEDQIDDLYICADLAIFLGCRDPKIAYYHLAIEVRLSEENLDDAEERLLQYKQLCSN